MKKFKKNEVVLVVKNNDWGYFRMLIDAMDVKVTCVYHKGDVVELPVAITDKQFSKLCGFDHQWFGMHKEFLFKVKEEL